MLRKLLGRYRSRQLDPWRMPDDLPACADTVALYRKRGVKIGKRVRLLGRIDGVNPHLVRIGDYSVLGLQGALLAHCPIKGAAPCRVGSFVYIAFGALVLPGVTIDDYCIIGAGAVVTRDVPSGSIAAGNPAKVLRQLTDAEKADLRDRFMNDRYFGRDEALP